MSSIRMVNLLNQRYYSYIYNILQENKCILDNTNADKITGIWKDNKYITVSKACEIGLNIIKTNAEQNKKCIIEEQFDICCSIVSGPIEFISGHFMGELIIQLYKNNEIAKYVESKIIINEEIKKIIDSDFITNTINQSDNEVNVYELIKKNNS